MNHNSNFWEHFSDHLILSASFFLMGMLVSMYLIVRFWRVKIDPQLNNDEIIRVIDDKTGKMWIIGNPKKITEYCELVLLTYFFKSNDKYIDTPNQKRLRVVSYIIITITIVIILSGVILLLSAFETDLNIFNYL